MFNKRWFALTVSACLLAAAAVGSGEEPQRNVAIFVYEGVEILDFAGPGEVFAATRIDGKHPFNVYTVAQSTAPIVSQGFVTVQPEYSIENCPKPDVIVLPGGRTSNAATDPVIHWVRTNAPDLDVALSVCTGAAVLARAGVLDGKQATTWYGYVDLFEQQFPQITVHRNTRFVDNGHMVTTAGVSAGIDGALHVVSQLLGQEVAQSTAKYMEYDKWQPDAGLIVENPALTAVANGPDLHGLNPKQEALFAGQFRNLAARALAEDRAQDALAILKRAEQLFPESALLNSDFARAYAKTDDRKMAEKYFVRTLTTNHANMDAIEFIGMEKALKHFRTLADEDRLSQNTINILGYRLLQKGSFKEALSVFELNVSSFPESWNAYDSLAEGYMKNGDNEKAIISYRKSLELNPQNSNATRMLEKLGTN